MVMFSCREKEGRREQENWERDGVKNALSAFIYIGRFEELKKLKD